VYKKTLFSLIKKEQIGQRRKRKRFRKNTGYKTYILFMEKMYKKKVSEKR